MRKKPRDPDSHSLLQEKAWDAFSKFIRARDCVASTHFPDSGVCVTCGKVYPFKKLQAGHFVPGRGGALLFDERGVHAQCYNCNINLKGNWVKYETFMLREYGQEVVDEIKLNKYRTLPISKEELRSTREYYQQRYQEILNKAGISFI